jgi:NAD+ kinase
VITLGGDGTVLRASYLFQQASPPLLPFFFGSLGFLTVFRFENYQSVLDELNFESGLFDIRMRLECSVEASIADGVDSPSESNRDKVETDRATLEKQWKTVGVFHVLNEVLVDRGTTSAMCSLSVYGDGVLMTTIHADGIALATPTGSTAYSVYLQ